MTKQQGAISLSVGISICIIAVVSMIVMSSSRSYTQSYVKDAIQQYDSSVTRIRNAQYDTIINRLSGIRKEIKDTSHE